jgi:hypothetical protein
LASDLWGLRAPLPPPSHPNIGGEFDHPPEKLVAAVTDAGLANFSVLKCPAVKLKKRGIF